MPVTDSYDTTPARRRWRYSLIGLFVLSLGASVGLAWWRLPNESISNGLLASFSTWFAFGMWQRWRQARQQRQQLRNASREIRLGAALEAAAPLGIVLLLLIAGAIRLAASWRQHGPGGIDLIDRTSLQLQGWLVAGLFYVAVIAAYWAPPRRLAGPRPHAAARILLQVALIAAGACWLTYFVVEETMVILLVHYAIRGVEMAQPMLLVRREFDPRGVDAGATEQFVQGGFAAALLLATATLTSQALIRRGQHGRLNRYLLLGVSVLLLVSVALLVRWCHNSALPQLSPAMAEHLASQPWTNRVLAAALLIAIALILALARVREPFGQNPFAASQKQAGQRPLHHHAGVVCLGLFPLLAMFCRELWTILPDLRSLTVPELLQFWQYFAQEFTWYVFASPERWLRAAAALVLAQALWRSLRSTHPWPSPLCAIDPYRFLTAFLLSVAVLALSGPVLAWWGLALQQWLLAG